MRFLKKGTWPFLVQIYCKQPEHYGIVTMKLYLRQCKYFPPRTHALFTTQLGSVPTSSGHNGSHIIPRKFIPCSLSVCIRPFKNIWCWRLKGAQFHFSKLRFHLYVENLLLNRSKFKISIKSTKPFRCMKQFCKLQLPILYCVSFSGIFPRDYFLAVKFFVDNEKNMGHLLIPKSHKAWEKVFKKGLHGLL